MTIQICELTYFYLPETAIMNLYSYFTDVLYERFRYFAGKILRRTKVCLQNASKQTVDLQLTFRLSKETAE